MRPVQAEEINQRQPIAAAALLLISGMAWARVGSMLSTRSTRTFFSSPGAFGLHVPQGHAGQLCQALGADIAQHGEGSLVGLGGGQRMAAATRISHIRRHDGAVDHSNPPGLRFPASNFPITRAITKNGSHLKRRSGHRQAHAGNIPDAFSAPQR